MKILEKDFTNRDFRYKQMYRDGKFAIYEQSKEGMDSKWFEAIVIESHNGYEIAGNVIPPSEMYPNGNQWGDKGFTFHSYDEAMDKIKFLKKKEGKKK